VYTFIEYTSATNPSGQQKNKAANIHIQEISGLPNGGSDDRVIAFKSA